MEYYNTNNSTLLAAITSIRKEASKIFPKNNKRQTNRRHNLSIYIDILKALTTNHSLKITHIMHKANINYKKATETLTFFEKQGIVERKTTTDNTTYTISEKGIQTLKCFKETTTIFPINHTIS